jgi:hypothetical protein
MVMGPWIRLAAVLAATTVFLSGPRAEAHELTCDGSKVECPALIEPEVIVKTLSSVARYCGFDAEGCARLTKGFRQCYVFIKRKALRGTLKHEMNHCRGWAHEGHGHHNHAKLWTPFPEVDVWMARKKEDSPE